MAPLACLQGQRAWRAGCKHAWQRQVVQRASQPSRPGPQPQSVTMCTPTPSRVSCVLRYVLRCALLHCTACTALPSTAHVLQHLKDDNILVFNTALPLQTVLPVTGVAGMLSDAHVAAVRACLGPGLLYVEDDGQVRVVRSEACCGCSRQGASKLHAQG